MQLVLDNLFIAFFVVFGGMVAFTLFTSRGKGLMLGGKIMATASEEVRQSSGMLTTTVRAHVVEARGGGKHVGIEISENAKLGASFKPLKLSKGEAETLIGMLNEVVSKT